MSLQGQSETVLLIEDDAGVAELICERLGDEGIRVAHVRTGRDARAWLENNRPLLVLLDYSLPDGSGAELVTQIKDMPPFIVTTGAGDERVAVTMMKHGALDYLVKDVGFLDALPLLVQQALRRIATERQLAEAQKALREKETLYRTVLDTAMDGFWVADSESMQILEVNDAYCAMSGYERAELLQMTIPQLDMIETSNDVQTHIRKIEQQSGDRFESRHRRKDGETLHLEISVQPMPEIGKVFVFLHDITARKQAEEQIRSALAEKEILLRELNHRTKNNLNIVSALVQLQSDMSDNPEFRALADSLENRIKSISMVHRMLYQSASLAHVDLEEYTRDLCSNLMHGFALSPEKIQVQVDAAPVSVDITTAIPCGQILNELISNALKYAFPGERSGWVHIQLGRAENGELVLRVSDNGVGLPPGFDSSEPKTLGLMIVQTLVGQLRGTLQIQSQDGMSCVIRFKEHIRA